MDWNGFNFKGELLSQSKAWVLTAGAAGAKKKEKKDVMQMDVFALGSQITKLLIVLLHLVFLQQKALIQGYKLQDYMISQVF